MRKLVFIIVIFVVTACNGQKTEHMKHTNALINSTSPYLLQHAHNPVDWHQWSEEIVERAKKENKLILISIYYSEIKSRRPYI